MKYYSVIRRTIETHNNMDEFQKQYAKWKIQTEMGTFNMIPLI